MRGSMTSAVAPGRLVGHGPPRRARPRRAPGSRRRASAGCPRPASARSVSIRLTGWPSASLTTRRWPSCPPSVSSWEYSRPARPVFSVPTLPEHLRRQVALRIGALGLDDRVDALDPELLDLVAHRRVHLVAQVDEGRVAVAQLLEQVVLGDAQQRGEPGRHAARGRRSGTGARTRSRRPRRRPAPGRGGRRSCRAGPARRCPRPAAGPRGRRASRP